ncbi:TM2 domain-containing protein [uncultured Slackia sp.]|uniref:TM2 domain-containing protein n=1 Tax=uncultured Slackia sp. TaxID=665903 RepID=UPI0025DAA9BB|nr:TM2 domain-containing protein [uncultured Slackia sp.]
MAEEAKNSAAAHAAEIEALKRQIEEMNKRLEELSAATSAEVAAEGASAEDDASASAASASAASAEVAEPAIQTQDNAEEEGGAEAEGVVEEKSACSSGPIEGAKEAIEVEAVPAPAPNVPAAAPEASGVFPNTPPIEKVVDDDGKPVDPAYVAAAVADFMPTSQPPKPAPPVFNGVPYGQQGAAPQQPAGQPQQPYAQPGYAAQQPYAQQPGQAAYYSQSNGYYAPGQGAYQVPYQQPLVHTKDHVAAGLLAIFLGVFGVHKFYLGYHTTGFIMLGVTILGSLLTIGIAAGVVWLIGVIEGIIYLTKSQSEFEQLYVFNKREMF